MRFEQPCDVYIAITDRSHIYRPGSTQFVALREDRVTFGDNAGVTILLDKGNLVHVGMTA